MKEYKLVGQEEILENIKFKEDGFARTVVAKCRSYELWDRCYGYYDNGNLVGVIVTTTSKRQPWTANLQLLFTYHEHRGHGYAREMVQQSFDEVKDKVDYFRVSSEKTAVQFYEKLGFQFQCKQKSGTSLSIFKVSADTIKDCDFTADDTMRKMFFRKGKGGCTEILDKRLRENSMYTKEDLSFGTELEISNIPKAKAVPEHLGKWEYSELDVVNTKGEYANICVDPRGELVPVGGEINTIPSKNFVDQVYKIQHIVDHFEEDEPDIGLTAHTHLHVHVDGLDQDPEALKKLAQYVYDNQDSVIKNCYRYDETKIPEGKEWSKIKRYLKFDGGRGMPDWYNDNIQRHTTDFETFHEAIKMGRDGTPIRHQRYFINLHSLFNSSTVEFRCFRGTLDKDELMSMFSFVEQFILNALNGGPSVDEMFKSQEFMIPEMQFDPDQARGWMETKQSDSRCKGKNREFWESDESSGETYEIKEKESELRLINFMGANGVGKSTRTKVLIDYLTENFDYKEFEYEVTRKGKEAKKEVIGLEFSNGWLVLGKFAKGGDQWVSLDAAFLSKWEHRIAFIEDISKHAEINTLFMEGYFNNRSRQSSPDNLKEHGVNEVHILTAYYDDIQEFIDRTNGRTGKERGLDWAENSAGWNDNQLFDKLFKEFQPMAKDGDVVDRLDIHCPVEELVHRYFEPDYKHTVKTQEPEKSSVLDEWF